MKGITFLVTFFFTSLIILESEAQAFPIPFTEVELDHFSFNKFLMGGGVAFVDIDKDGYDDIYISGGEFVDKVFRNVNGTSFQEIEIPELSITSEYVTNGIGIADINRDYLPDLVLLTGDLQNRTSNLIFLNDGNFSFTDITSNSGILGDEAWSMGVTFGDFNLDGFIDFYVANYIDTTGISYDENGNFIDYGHIGSENKLYMNINGISFEEGQVANLQSHLKGNTLACTASDYDFDLDMDIYVLNDFGTGTYGNVFLTNQTPTENELFSENNAPIGANSEIFSMGVAIGDYDRDLDLDYYITNIGANLLLNNQANNSFLDYAETSGVENEFINQEESTSWGASFLDINNNTWLDLVVSNGYIPLGPSVNNSDFDPNRIFINNQNSTFTEHIFELQDDSISFNSSRGLAYSDIDNDGDLDLLFGRVGSLPDHNFKTALIINQLTEKGNWLKVELCGTNSNTDAYGAKVFLKTGDVFLLKEVDGGSSHASKSSNILHFGLDTHDSVDNITVVWPGGKIQNFGSYSANQKIKLIENNLILPNNYLQTVIDGSSFYTVNNFQSDICNSYMLFGFGSEIIAKDSYGNVLYNSQIPGFYDLCQVLNGSKTCEFIYDNQHNNSTIQIVTCIDD